MKKIALAATTALVTAGAAQAGGIDRSGQFLGPVFEATGETGNYVAFSLGSVSPSAGYTDNVTGLGAGTDPLPSYTPWGLAYKRQFTDALSFTLIADQPFGAEVAYVDGRLTGGRADVTSQALTGVVRYEFGNGFSVHGGLRAQEMQGQIASVVGGAPRLLTASSAVGFGGLIGAAYERPDIALRVALTYNSEITQDFDGTEVTTNALGVPIGIAQTAFEVKTPASWNLEFQSGVAPDTLVFGSIRYVEWDGFNLTTPGAGEYVSFSNNSTTYSLGVGRRFNENWSGAVTFGYEEAASKVTTTALAPTAGSKSIGLGATYTQGKTKITMGVTYADLGDTELAGTGGLINFTDNKAIGAGIRVGFAF